MKFLDKILAPFQVALKQSLETFIRLETADNETTMVSSDGSLITYLKGVVETVMRDPFFCSLEDPINEAHLFQIVYDNKVTLVEGVPFRDDKLARKIFPDL